MSASSKQARRKSSVGAPAATKSPIVKLVPTPGGISIKDPEAVHAFPIYAAELPGTRPADGSETGIYRNAIYDLELHPDFPAVKTLHDAFMLGVKEAGNKPFLGHRPEVRHPVTGELLRHDPYVWQTYRHIAERRVNFACGLNKINADTLHLPEKWRFAIYAPNRPEWVIADLAAHLFSLCTVSLYDTLGPETSEYILNHAEVSLAVASLDKVEKLLQLAPKCPELKVIVSMDGPAPPPAGAPAAAVAQHAAAVAVSPFGLLRAWAAEKGIILYSFLEVEALGRENRVPFLLPTASDILTFSYTSGTTGVPKAAMIRHGNVVATLRGWIESGNANTPDDVCISYMPMAHIYERGLISIEMMTGCRVGFYRGDAKYLIEDIVTLRPTVLCSVPRVWNRVADSIKLKVSLGSPLSKAIFQTAYNAKLEHLKATGSFAHAFWDALVFNKVKMALGGKIRAMFSGAAPLSPEVARFLSIVMCVPLGDGYAQTENAAGCTVAFGRDLKLGHVGSVISSCEMKLVSVPEMNYLASDKPYPRGEIWVRGGSVFAGYYKDPEKTSETLTEDGWLKSGDIGYLDEKGRLFLIDRKKNIFKLAQGEYVAPEKIENMYITSPLVGQIYVHGDRLQNQLVGIVVLAQEIAVPAAVAAGILPASTPRPDAGGPGLEPPASVVALTQSEPFRKLLQRELDRVAAEGGLHGFEQVKNVRVVAEYFSLESGLLTPTLKLKRPEAAKKFAELIKDMYDELEAAAPGAKL
ncbi:hypothetical protein HK405_004940, partial [Cladochytrium tenue]